ncbi:hypothetical protein VNI00_009407 [Paramarasmius palmivorus]|uniref:Uncharacterized protein n=1 Tax=Paramarasmius palmivorus TaxID=297713 RepID=A0AAW0CQI7_9AGAR
MSAVDEAFGYTISDNLEKIFATQIPANEIPEMLESTDIKSFIIERYRAAYEHLLLRYMHATSINKFRTLQHNICALIVGSTAFGTFTKQAPGSPFQLCTFPQYFSLLIKFFETEGFDLQKPFSHVPSGSCQFLAEGSPDNAPTVSLGARPTISTTCDEKYVKDVYRMSRLDGRKVEIIVAKTHPMEYVLNVTSSKRTLFVIPEQHAYRILAMMMCFISSSEMIMLYPELTLRYRMTFDFTRPTERNIKISSTYFSNGEVVVNPFFTVYDSLSYARDTGSFPRQVGDAITGAIPLKWFNVPAFMTLGHRAMLRPHSWQMYFTENNFPSIRFEFMKATRLLQTYLVAPALYGEYKTRLPKEVNLPLTHVNTSHFAVRPFADEDLLPFFTMVYEELYGPTSNLRILVDDLQRGLNSSRKDASFTMAEQFPPAAISIYVVSALSKLKGVQSCLVKRPASMDISSTLGVQFFVNLSSSNLSTGEEALIQTEMLKLRDLGSEIVFIGKKRV